jgi:hypothetical protein
MNTDRPAEGPGVKFPPPLLYLALLILGILLSVWYPVHFLPSALAWTLGGIILAGGMLLGPIWGYGPCAMRVLQSDPINLPQN